ncbi:hypothetical protein BE221DRAFT_190119 [Ostreococcus tauri]|uniref:Uncharacterized protein n=1 Tax=Ostreococcus tauri TaxID=70448 RepID=A0A1Y5II06_OSTTA|nr:hypothetical protein BE221DRAFT_190119 [Ostreococcus tauri]
MPPSRPRCEPRARRGYRLPSLPWVRPRRSSSSPPFLAPARANHPSPRASSARSPPPPVTVSSCRSRSARVFPPKTPPPESRSRSELALHPWPPRRRASASPLRTTRPLFSADHRTTLDSPHASCSRFQNSARRRFRSLSSSSRSSAIVSASIPSLCARRRRDRPGAP